jgi:hypothetical protein
LRTGHIGEYLDLKRNEVAGGQRKLLNEVLCNLYSSPDIIRMSKSRKVRLLGHVAHMEKMRSLYKILVGKPEGRYCLEDLGVNVRIILKWILGK